MILIQPPTELSVGGGPQQDASDLYTSKFMFYNSENKRSLCTKFERNRVVVVRVTAPSLFTSKMAARPPF